MGPLAWIAEDVGRCLDAALKALASGQASVAAAALHQAAGALELAGNGGVARVVTAIEALARHQATQPLTDPVGAERARQVEQRATFAVLEFIDAQLHGRSVEAVALYPQYCELLDLAGDTRARQRAHPADLWVVPPGLDLQALEAPAPEAPDDAIESIELSGGGPEQLHVAQYSGPVVSDFPTGVALRARLDQAVLQFVKTGSAAPASELAFLCDGLSRDLAQGLGPSAPAWRRLWRLAAAFFEMQATWPAQVDLAAKRGASRLLVAYSQWAAGTEADIAPLAHELLYACAATGRPIPRSRRAWRRCERPAAWRTPRP
jgi:chemosensory pili system protein ChpA (sensor histidine kinase/response regulator)